VSTIEQNEASSGAYDPASMPTSFLSSPLMNAHAVASMGNPDARLREYERRSALQDEMLRPACRRAEHRAHIQEQLKRLGVREVHGSSHT